MARAVATAGGAVALLAAALGTTLHAVNAAAGRTLEPSFWLLTALGGLAFGATAVLLAGRVPRRPRVDGRDRRWVRDSPCSPGSTPCSAPGPLDAAALWVGSWLWAPAHLSIACVLPLLLPDGSSPPGRWSRGIWSVRRGRARSGSARGP